MGLCAASLSLAGVFLYLDPQIPRAESYRNVQLETPLRVFSEDGALLAEFGERRLIPITLDDVPTHFINALLDTEDKRFYEHSGIDFISLTNDVFSLVGSLITEGELTGGASTITMQLARNVSFTLERRFLRKFKEMLLALKIEQELTKDEILELYINVVPFGKRAYGAEAAALTYYGKPLKALDLPQLAMLAGIPQAPSAGNPINGPERALTRRNLVLSRMHAQESISTPEYEAARAAPISARIFARELDVSSPYAAEWVRQQAITLLPDLYTGGYEITTTINSAMQREAIASLRRGLMSYDRRHGYRGPEAGVEEALRENLLDAAGLLWPTAEAAVPEAVASPNPENAEDADLLDIAAPATPSLTAYPEDLQREVLETLRTIPDFGELAPALVLAVDEGRAIVLKRDGDAAVLAFDDADWARPYIEVDLRGPAPESMSDIVSVGDVIRIRRNEDPEGNPWLLTQLPEIQGALVALDPENGAVRALVGGFDFYRNQYNHALQAARQPGSGFKPFVYSAAIANGVTSADMFMDAPLVFDDENLESEYRPDNDNNRYNGPTRLREALYRSINLVSMRVLLKVGAGNVLDHVAKFGFDNANFPRNTQLAIGGGTMAVTPMDMARAYAVFANGGYLVDPNILVSIKDASGKEIFRANHPRVCPECELEDLPVSLAGEMDEEAMAEPTSLEDLLAATETEVEEAATETAETATDMPEGESLLLPPQPDIPALRVVDERNVFVMHSMLKDVIKRGTGVSARRLQRDDLAGKTGTTNDAADTWFNGYSPDLVTTVWVGFSNHAPLGARAYGSNTPLPIWIDFMEEALAGIDEAHPTQPPGVVTLKIDPTTGSRARPGQNNAIFEYFLAEHAPEAPSTRQPNQPAQDEEIKAIDLF